MTAQPSAPGRREFLKTSTATVAGTLAALAMPRGVHAAGSDVLKVGLIGCGGRGSGAAAQALKADPNVKLWAMADAFADRIEFSLKNLAKAEDLADKIDVAPERRFAGFDAYKQVIDACDVVLLATPPHFRPMHLKAAVDAGKHVFAEKPVAVDAPGVRSVLATCEEAKRKNLSIVSGLCLRYDYSFAETVKRIHDGAVGQIVALQANDYRGPIWVHPRKPDWSDMTWQMRNWYYFTWLCGDFNVEQHVHMLDMCSWAIGSDPVQAIATGGRQVRTEPEFGHIFDHFSVTYEYGNGARLFATCRQQTGCANEISAHVLGTKGTAVIAERKRGPSITTADGEWTYTGKKNQMYQTEHDELFASIRSGQPINNGDYMSRSTLLAIMGRMAAYTGQLITWEMAMNSQEDLSPPRYDWDVELPMPPVAKPGVTKFV
jgi:predicted dehydrogenase